LAAEAEGKKNQSTRPRQKGKTGKFDRPKKSGTFGGGKGTTKAEKKTGTFGRSTRGWHQERSYSKNMKRSADH